MLEINFFGTISAPVPSSRLGSLEPASRTALHVQRHHSFLVGGFKREVGGFGPRYAARRWVCTTMPFVPSEQPSMMQRVRGFQNFLRQFWAATGYEPITGYHNSGGTSLMIRLNCSRFRVPQELVDEVDAVTVQLCGGLVRSSKRLDLCPVVSMWLTQSVGR